MGLTRTAGFVVAIAMSVVPLASDAKGGGGHSGGGHSSGGHSGGHSGSHASGGHSSGSHSTSSHSGSNHSSRINSPGPGTGSKSSSVNVHGYTRKDGTHVAPSKRSTPDKNFKNNWSTKGNTNPSTGKKGTATTPPPKKH